MNINVDINNVTVCPEEMHSGEYNINTLNFTFSSEYEGISKVAVFTTNDLNAYSVPITNNMCIIPEVVLAYKGTVLFGVYGYVTENNELVKRYSPAPIKLTINRGSYVANTQNAQTSEPTLFETFVEQIEGNFDTITGDITALENGKQDVITNNNKLPSDLVTDTNQTNKFVTSEDKTRWDNKSNFSGDYNDLTNKPTIPSKTSQLTNDSGFIDKNVNNLTNYELKVDTGHSIELSLNTTTFVMTLNLKNSAGTTISTGSIDLPMESVVVNGAYDITTKEVVLTLVNGSEIRFSVADLVSGLQTEITNDNKLSADLVSDSGTTNKFTTSENLTKLSGIEAGAEVNVIDTVKVDGTALTPTDKAVDIVGIGQLQADTSTLFNQLPVKTTQSTSGQLTITDSAGLPLDNAKVLGNATQFTTTGKNKLKVTNATISENNSTYTANNGLISVISQNRNNSYDIWGGTRTASYLPSYSNANDYQITTADQQTYKISISNVTNTTSGNANNFISIFTNQRAVNAYIYNNATTLSNTTSITLAENEYIKSVYLWTNESNNTNISFNVQLEKGSTATAYEPYTGGIASPNPDYPQDIHVVTGNNTVTITGKNINNGVDYGFYINSAGTEYRTSAGDKGLCLQVYGGNYTISTTITQTRYRLACTNELPSATAQTCYVPALKDNTKSNVTIDTTGYKYLIINCTDISAIQVEKGSTATEYVAYQGSQTLPLNLGNIKLVGINDYEDTIYKSNNKWYLQKMTGEVTVTKDANWAIKSTDGGTNNQFYCSTDVENNIRVQSTTDKQLCNYGVYNYGSWNYGKAWQFALLYNTRQLCLGMGTSIKTVDELKTLLTSKPIIIYFQYRNIPAPTEITDTDLINQLEAIKNASTYKTTTNFTLTPSGTNATGDIEITYKRDLTTVIDNIEARLSLLE